MLCRDLGVIRLVAAIFFASLVTRGAELTEQQAIALFESSNPRIEAINARLAALGAAGRQRSLYGNPSLNYSREGAGFTEFLQVETPVVLSGRLRLLRQAGEAAVTAGESGRDAIRWELRSDMRAAFYRLLVIEQRSQLLNAGLGDLDEILRVLRVREQEGEGSKYDRLRAERERTEQQAEVEENTASAAFARGALAAFLPPGTAVAPLSGVLLPASSPKDLDAVMTAAIAARAELRALTQAATALSIEEAAARKLRLPEPTVNAGMKRSASGSSLVLFGVPAARIDGAPAFTSTFIGLNSFNQTAYVAGVSVPIPSFNRGQFEVSRLSAEQRAAQLDRQALERSIRARVGGAHQSLSLRWDAYRNYRQRREAAGDELMRIVRLAYQEGELGILELLDALRTERLYRLRLHDLAAEVRLAQIELDREAGVEVNQ